MDLAFTPEEQKFAADVRAFVKANLPADVRDKVRNGKHLNRDDYMRDGAMVSAAADYAALGTFAGACHHCHTGKCPVGITTQDPALESRLDVEGGARRIRNFLTVLTMEAQTLARACGKSHLHNLEPEDLAALTVEAAAMAGVPLAGTDWIPGKSRY